MLYAIVNNEKVRATKGNKGICPLCDKEVRAYCGQKMVRHWKHKKNDCDPWAERDSEWHVSWQKLFPEKYVECIITKNGERHRADVRTKNGVIIEFQHSPISEEEIAVREEFYGEKMLWVLDAQGKFHNLSYEIGEDFNPVYQALVGVVIRGSKFVVFPGEKVHDEIHNYIVQIGFEKYENDNEIVYKAEGGKIGWCYCDLDIQDKINRVIKDYNLKLAYNTSQPVKFWWKHRKISFDFNKRPIFLDFGTEVLFHIMRWGLDEGTGVGEFISKERF
jgi:hypothetical protein